MCVFICVNFWSVFGAGTPVDSFPVARREPAFRLLFNKPADRAYWLWTDRGPRWEKQGKRKRGKGGGRRREDAGTEEEERKENGQEGKHKVEAQPCCMSFLC